MEIEKPSRKIPNILVTGTPGVGKTTLGKLLPEYIENFLIGLKEDRKTIYMID